MKWVLHRPSFWPEPRDPWAWQRALALIAKTAPAPDPWPCWEQLLRNCISRRSVAGLYGLRRSPGSRALLGVGLLSWTEDGWVLDPGAERLLHVSRDQFQHALAKLLVRRSPWVRLALCCLAAGAWTLPRGVAPLHAGRQLRVGEDLRLAAAALAESPHAQTILGELYVPEVTGVVLDAGPRDLSALHGPLYLLHALEWLDGSGRPRLPDELAASVAPEIPAVLLRRITSEEADAKGFVVFSRVARRLWLALHPKEHNGAVSAWVDDVFDRAISRGAIEVHAWAPGQPRHGRGWRGDRDRKLVRWTIHDDFTLPSQPTARRGSRS